jgi:hypothetical protein
MFNRFRYSFFAFCWLVVFSFSVRSQDLPTYYFMGRPHAILRNNAIRLVGAQWKIRVEHASNDLLESLGMDNLNNHNDSIFRLLAVRTGKGDNWLSDFYADVDAEESRLRLLIKQVNHTKEFTSASELVLEPIVLIERKKTRWINKVKYDVFLVGQLKDDQTRVFRTVFAWNFWQKSRKLQPKKRYSDKLPFTLPQNGIV